MQMLRRHIRDVTNPFDIPSMHFKQMSRLDQQIIIDLIHRIESYYNRSNSRIPLHKNVKGSNGYIIFLKFFNLYSIIKIIITKISLI